jgi:1,4-alpha-glucan branching enzyme
MAGSDKVPMGANLVAGGATFRAWAPEAKAIYVRGDFNNWSDSLGSMTPDGQGYWQKFAPGVQEGAQYKFFVVGQGGSGYKRDPYARALTLQPAFPRCNCLVTQPSTFPWHDQTFRPPRFNDLMIYQFHVGVYYATNSAGTDERTTRGGRFLDLLFRLEYLADLGINAIEPLPIDEFPSEMSLGYNGTDYFSPEMAYTVPPFDPQFVRYVQKANELLAKRGQTRFFQPGELHCQTKQLMALVDLCHLYGIAVIFDVVYNHAGGDFGDESFYFFDRQPSGDNNRSQYFTDQGWAGGLVFAYWKREVCQFLIDNAEFYFQEYHADGFRFDEVTVIDDHGGWAFCQDLTSTLHDLKPSAPLIAEFWKQDQSYVVKARDEGGAGFDGVWASGLRQAIRDVVSQAAVGRDQRVNLDQLRDRLYPPFGEAWRTIQHLENHDVVRINNTSDRQPRIAALADGSNSRSWYARSLARVANGLLLTAPGIPMLFMGQEFLEDKFWSDNSSYYASTLIWWDGLETDKAMQDHLRCTRELIALRRSQPALCGDKINVFHVHNDNRIIAFHRWVEAGGCDVVVVVSLNESTFWNYRLGFPASGLWREAFNSDVYDNWVNPQIAGNQGAIFAIADSLHGFPAAAEIVIPANSILVFTR